MNKYVLLLILITPGLTHATKVELSGQGKVLSEPDYVELRLHINSQCYNTPQDAANANDKAAAKIVSYLNSKVKNDGYYNKVVSHGGYTQTFQSYHRNNIYCKDTFQKSNNIIFRTKDINNFANTFNAIQDKVLESFAKNPKNYIESEITFATISSPQPLISQDKQTELEQQAMSLALKNAKAKLTALFKGQSIDNFKITHISEQAAPIPSPIYNTRQKEMMLASDSAHGASYTAPVQFDSQWLNKTLYFTFEFE